MAVPSRLHDVPIPATAVHLCIDMQRLYAGGTPWSYPWMPRVLPLVVALCERQAPRTLFTRFIPAERPGDGHGMWRAYFRRWAKMTLESLGPGMVGLVPELARFAPPAEVVDKHVYSPWVGTSLHDRLRARGTDTLVLTGGESDMCVLAALLGAIDLGYRIILVQDAICSTSDAAHDSMLRLVSDRFGIQVEIGTTEELLELWPAPA